MLMPSKVKFRKQQRGRMRGKAWRGGDVSFGDYGLKALEPCWLTDRQIEAARVAMTRFVKRGAEVDKLRDELQRRTKAEVHINIIEIQRPETDAQLVSESIALQLERRVAFRRAMKKGIESAFRFGAQGIKIRCAGRLNGAEIARSEWYQEGRLPLHTLKADIDYGFAEANTTYGKIGVKVWVFHGLVPDARLHEHRLGRPEEAQPR